MDMFYEKIPTEIYFFNADGLTNMLHLHKELEIIYCKHGKAIAYVDKNSYSINDGDLFVVFPNQLHYYKNLEFGEYSIFIFSPSLVYGEGDELSKSIPDINHFPAPNKEITRIVNAMNKADGKYKGVALNGYINTIMSIILPQMKLKTVTGDKNSAFYSITDFCSRNFREDITLDFVSKSIHLSKYYISHLINTQLKQSFSEYINSLRINEACRLLRETDNKITDISLYVGCGTIRSFNRSFKQIMGVSPAEYRRKSKELRGLSAPKK